MNPLSNPKPEPERTVQKLMTRKSQAFSYLQGMLEEREIIYGTVHDVGYEGERCARFYLIVEERLIKVTHKIAIALDIEWRYNAGYEGIVVPVDASPFYMMGELLMRLFDDKDKLTVQWL